MRPDKLMLTVPVSLRVYVTATGHRRFSYHTKQCTADFSFVQRSHGPGADGRIMNAKQRQHNKCVNNHLDDFAYIPS
jgi:hypothetical protein